MFFENKRQLLYTTSWLITICLVGFFAGLAWGQPNQDCTYITNIAYDSSGQIIDAKQTYECKTPQPQVVEKIVYEQQPENIVNVSYNTSIEEPVTWNDVITGLYVLGTLLGGNN